MPGTVLGIRDVSDDKTNKIFLPIEAVQHRGGAAQQRIIIINILYVHIYVYTYIHLYMNGWIDDKYKCVRR